MVHFQSHLTQQAGSLQILKNSRCCAEDRWENQQYRFLFQNQPNCHFKICKRILYILKDFFIKLFYTQYVIFVDAMKIMFRKLGNIMTMCLLLVSTTGFSVSEHFCGSNLISVKVNQEAEPCCDNAMCCHTETHFYQLDEDFNFTSDAFDFRTLAVTDIPQMIIPLQTKLYAVDRDMDLFADFESPPPLERKEFLSAIQTYLL